MTSERILDVRIVPADAELRRRRSITIDGATPDAVVTVKATTMRNGVEWTSRVSFLADSAGRVDLDADAPISGRYRVADAMGVLWSQTAAGSQPGGIDPESVELPLVTTIEAWSEVGTGAGASGAGEERGTALLVQRIVGEGVRRIHVREDGLIGTLFVPDGDGPFPTIIVMNGSGGGLNEVRAAQYASCGIQALALGYFRVPGRPRYISRTPLEYFENAIDYVTRELAPLGGKPLVSGQSRGGELTLLLASRFPERIAGIVAFVPAAFVFGAQGAADPDEGWDGPTWTWQGQPLEHLWHDNRGVTWQPWDGVVADDPDRDVYIDGLHDRGLAAAARIPIESFRGPVACVSGLDDRAWPSSMASRLVMRTLERSGHTAERLHLDFESAGHITPLPFMPTTNTEVLHPVSGARYSNGGTVLGNARAAERSFEEVCAFIHRAARGQQNQRP